MLSSGLHMYVHVHTHEHKVITQADSAHEPPRPLAAQWTQPIGGTWLVQKTGSRRGWAFSLLFLLMPPRSQVVSFTHLGPRL